MTMLNIEEDDWESVGSSSSTGIDSCEWDDTPSLSPSPFLVRHFDTQVKRVDGQIKIQVDPRRLVRLLHEPKSQLSPFPVRHLDTEVERVAPPVKFQVDPRRLARLVREPKSQLSSFSLLVRHLDTEDERVAELIKIEAAARRLDRLFPEARSQFVKEMMEVQGHAGSDHEQDTTTPEGQETKTEAEPGQESPRIVTCPTVAGPLKGWRCAGCLAGDKCLWDAEEESAPLVAYKANMQLRDDSEATPIPIESLTEEQKTADDLPTKLDLAAEAVEVSDSPQEQVHVAKEEQEQQIKTESRPKEDILTSPTRPGVGLWVRPTNGSPSGCKECLHEGRCQWCSRKFGAISPRGGEEPTATKAPADSSEKTRAAESKLDLATRLDLLEADYKKARKAEIQRFESWVEEKKLSLRTSAAEASGTTTYSTSTSDTTPITPEQKQERKQPVPVTGSYSHDTPSLGDIWETFTQDVSLVWTEFKKDVKEEMAFAGIDFSALKDAVTRAVTEYNAAITTTTTAGSDSEQDAIEAAFEDSEEFRKHTDMHHMILNELEKVLADKKAASIREVAEERFEQAKKEREGRRGLGEEELEASEKQGENN